MMRFVFWGNVFVSGMNLVFALIALRGHSWGLFLMNGLVSVGSGIAVFVAWRILNPFKR